MFTKTVLIMLLCALVLCEGKIRVKRGKYYSNPPQRFYRRPPLPNVVKGAFSYTPPPNYMSHDEGYRTKVSKKPTNNLGDEDINNLVKYLTKQDLDKIVEFANEKERYTDKYRDVDDSLEKGHEYTRPSFKRPERTAQKDDGMERYRVEYEYSPKNYVTAKPKIYATPPTYQDEYLDKNPNLNFINDATQTKIMYSQPDKYRQQDFTQTNQDFSNAKIVYTNPQELYQTMPNPNEINAHFQQPFSDTTHRQQGFTQTNQDFSNAKVIYTNPQELYQTMPNPNEINANLQQSFLNQYPKHSDSEESMHQKISYINPTNENTKNYIYTDSSIMKEEELPKPLNLREDDYEISYTNNVPKVVTPDSYKVESLKDVPLMNYHNSKLHSVSSYYVPHYTVTSTKSQQPQSLTSPLTSSSSSSIQAPPLERAPPGSTGKDQSDAHLKAVRIWTHRSKGTAYTLHDDGTLSLEKPKFKGSYGHP